MLMEVTGPEKGLQKLENLADYLDELPDGRYNQWRWDACAAHHYFSSQGATEKNDRGMHEILAQMLHKERFYLSMAAEFHISVSEAERIFTDGGCGDAGLCAKAAARWLREFVMEKRKVMV